MVRLVFRPYTQVRRSICTLESRRTPPEFPLASPYSGIVHHLSGPNMYAHTQTFLPRDHGRSIVQFPSYLSTRCIHIYSALGGLPRALAHMLDSLVRVSRRDDKRHFVRVPHRHDGKTDLDKFRSLSRADKEA